MRLHFLPNAGPRRIAYVNRMGMLISDSLDQKVNPVSPRRSALWPDFAAVVVPDTDKGDAWSRRMETPSHDAVSPERLRDPKDTREARRIFQDARRAIRDAIDAAIGMDERYEESNIQELRDLLPDEPGDIELVSDEGNPPSPPVINTDDDDEESGNTDDGETDENGFLLGNGGNGGGGGGNGGGGGGNGGNGGGGNGGGGGGNGGSGGNGGNGNESNPSRNRRAGVRIGDPRYIGENAYACRVSFELSDKVKHVTLTLTPAGVERGEKVKPIKVVAASLMGKDLDCDENGAVHIPDPPINKKLTVRIETSESIANRAIDPRRILKAQQL